MQMEEILLKFLELLELRDQRDALERQWLESKFYSELRDNRRDLKLHERDKHGQHCDTSVYLESRRTDQAERHQVHKQLEALSRQIKSLEDEIKDALVAKV
jgi:hypothetical protein